MTTHRTAEDAQYRPIRGDKFNYPPPFENADDLVLRVEGDRVTYLDPDGEAVTVSVASWAAGRGVYTPVGGDL